ncbi:MULTISPECIES: helix-turn-helix domain-containing protein [Leisingera]|jgi:AraC-like DNA-binding protein|uniref:helix-turn-helix domain-containing protein n=1 Tax=Leisingera TaxID=191028 RepID=UPI00115291D2|nr:MULTISPECIES: helix-turn-helix domain-containing protein [Leisingera]QDI78166.1 helix-turn-helix domain-containing protein [Leisingera aquaemixtae]
MICFDSWNSTLRANCGHYYATPEREAGVWAGSFGLRRRSGVDVAEIRCPPARIERTRKGILRDDQEHFFLLHQLEGETGIQHAGRETLLQPGELLLLDSTRAAELRVSGRPAAFRSAHLPRALVLERRREMPAAGCKIAPPHPLHASLCGLLEGTGGEDSAGYIFDLVPLAFAAGARPGAGSLGSRRHRFRLVRETLELLSGDPGLTVDRLAARTGLSRRQLQREFQENGTTFTECLTRARLAAVAGKLRHAARQGARVPIAQIAYGAGFGDISHFNRTFRQQFGCSPRRFLSTCSLGGFLAQDANSLAPVPKTPPPGRGCLLRSNPADG